MVQGYDVSAQVRDMILDYAESRGISRRRVLAALDRAEAVAKHGGDMRLIAAAALLQADAMQRGAVAYLHDNGTRTAVFAPDAEEERHIAEYMLRRRLEKWPAAGSILDRLGFAGSRLYRRYLERMRSSIHEYSIQD